MIAITYLLEQKQDYEGAHEVATVTRRLFKEQNIFPEPPDEKPLLEVEQSVKDKLESETYENIISNTDSLTVKTIIDKYL